MKATRAFPLKSHISKRQSWWTGNILTGVRSCCDTFNCHEVDLLPVSPHTAISRTNSLLGGEDSVTSPAPTPLSPGVGLGSVTSIFDAESTALHRDRRSHELRTEGRLDLDDL